MGDESGWRLAPLAMYGEDAGEDDMSMMMAMPDLEPTGAKGGGGGGKSRGRSKSKPAKSNKRAASRSKSRGNKDAKKQQKQQKKALSRSKSQERKAKKQQQKQQQKERSRSKSQERKAKKQQDKERSRSKSQERKAKKEQQKQQQKERSRSKSQERKAKKQQDKERSRSKSQERKAKKQQDKERSRSKSQERKLSRSKSRESKAAAKQQKKQARSKSRDSNSGSSAADKRGRSRSKSQDKTNAKKNNNKQDKERSRSKKKDKKKDKEEQSEGDAGDQDDDRSNKKRRASKSRSRSRGRGSGGGSGGGGGGGGFSGPPGGGSRSGSSGSGSGGGNGGTSNNNNNDTNDYQQQQQQQYPYAQPQPPPQYIYQQGNAPAAPPTGPIIVSAGVPQPTPAPTIIVAQPQQPQRQRQIIQVAVPSSSTEVENAKPGDLITVRVPPPGERLVINSTAAAIPDAQGLRILDNPDVLLAGLAPSKELTALQRSNYIEAFIAHKQAMRNPTQRAALSRRIAHSLNDQNAWDNLVDNYLTRNGVGDDPNEPAGTVAKIKYEARQLAQLAMTTTSVAAAATTDSVSMNPTKRGASYQEPPEAAPAAAPTLTPSERKRDSQPRDPRTGRYEVAPKVAALKSTATAAFAENAEIRCQSTQNHLGHCADYREVHIYGAEHSGVDLWNVHRLLTVEGAEKAMVAISAIREIRNETFPVDGTIGADGKASDNFLQIATIYENRGSVVSRPGWVIPFVQSAPERAATFKIGSETLQAVTRQYRPRDPSGKKPSWEGALMNAEGRSVPLRLHLASPITAALKGAGTQKIGLDVHVFVPSRRDLDPRGKGTPPTEVFGFIPYANLHIEPDPTGWTPIVWALVRIKFDKEGKLDRVHVTVVTPDVLPRDPDADTTLVISTNGFWYRHRALGEHHLTPGGSPAWVCDYVPLVSGNQHPDEPNPTGARILGVRIGRDSSTKKDPVAKATEGEQHHLEDLASVNAKLRDLGVVGVELSDVLEKVWISPVSGEMSPITNISLIAKEKAAVEPVKVQSLAYKPVGGSIKTHFKSRDIATKGVEGSLTRVADEHAATADLRILALRNLPKQNLVQLTSNNHNGFQLELTFDPTAANARSWALVPRTIRLDGPEKDLRKVFSDKYLAAIVDHHPAPPFVVVVGQDMDKSPGDIKHLDKSAQLVNIWILYSGNT